MEDTNLSPNNVEIVYNTILNKPIKHKFNTRDHV